MPLSAPGEELQAPSVVVTVSQPGRRAGVLAERGNSPLEENFTLGSYALYGACSPLPEAGGPSPSGLTLCEYSFQLTPNPVSREEM